MSTKRPTVERLGLSRAALAGQTAVVTGAGRGIGRATAKALAWLGARVVIAELDEASGRDAAGEIQAADGQALFVQTDVAAESAVAALAAQAQAWGPVDVLVNNAILCPAASVLEMDAALWDKVIAVNLRGAFLTCRAFLPGMLTRGRGTIVNMISTDAMPGLSAYIASKQGLAGFSQSLAAEVGERGVRVIAFGPGLVDTPAIRAVAPGLAPRLGLTPEQFLSLSLHPAYDGLMPADHAGAATAYLIAALADEHHGDRVDAYAVLERAGLLRPASAVPPAVTSAPPDPGATVSDAELRALGGQLRTMLAETEAEFNQLPVFIRPLARSGFKAKAGGSLADWARAAAALAEAGPDQARAAAQKLKPGLPKLVVYYEGVPAETARFTREAGLLSQVQRLTEARLAVIRRLDVALRAL